MKITKSQLKQVIQEELENVLQEGVFDRFRGKEPSSADKDMERSKGFANHSAEETIQPEFHDAINSLNLDNDEYYYVIDELIKMAKKGELNILNLRDMSEEEKSAIVSSVMPGASAAYPDKKDTDNDGIPDQDELAIIDRGELPTTGFQDDKRLSEKITKSQLKQIIKEELSNAVEEGNWAGTENFPIQEPTRGEGSMAQGQLQRISELADEISQQFDNSTNLEEWVEAKITKAQDYLSSVMNYMGGKADEKAAGEILATKMGSYAGTTLPGGERIK